MPWAESYTSRTKSEIDVNNNGRATLTYIVTVTPSTDNPNNNPFKEPGKPDFLSEHPFFPQFKLAGFSEQRLIVNNIYEIDGYFSSDGSFGILQPPPKDTTFTYKFVTGSGRRKVLKAPMYQEYMVSPPSDTGNAPDVSKFKRLDLDIETFEADYEVRLAVKTLTLSDIENVFSQYNKLHKFDGVYFKFVSFRFSNSVEGKWDLCYTWTYDNGSLGLGNGIATLPPPVTTVDSNGQPKTITYTRKQILPPYRPPFFNYWVEAPTAPQDTSGNENPSTILVIPGYTTADLVNNPSILGFPGNPFNA